MAAEMNAGPVIAGKPASMEDAYSRHAREGIAGLTAAVEPAASALRTQALSARLTVRAAALR